MDRILFQYAVSESRSGHESAGADIFRQLMREFPDSAFTLPAAMVVTLRDDIVRLQTDQKSKDEKIQQLTALLPPPTPVLPPALMEAESAYESGDFARAARSYETYVQSRPQSAGMDGILFRFAVAQSLSGIAASESGSNDTFKQLIKEFSSSPYASYARRVIDFRESIARSQLAEKQRKEEMIRQLTDQLETIKRADSERRRTP
jgi:hypothetical protein